MQKEREGVIFTFSQEGNKYGITCLVLSLLDSWVTFLKHPHEYEFVRVNYEGSQGYRDGLIKLCEFAEQRAEDLGGRKVIIDLEERLYEKMLTAHENNFEITKNSQEILVQYFAA